MPLLIRQSGSLFTDRLSVRSMFVQVWRLPKPGELESLKVTGGRSCLLLYGVGEEREIARKKEFERERERERESQMGCPKQERKK